VNGSSMFGVPDLGLRFRWWSVVLLCACFGCGNECERRLEGAGQQSQKQLSEKFGALNGPRQVPEPPVSIRLPRGFAAAPPSDVRRSKPGNISTIPAPKLACEGFIKDADEGQMSYYLFVGVAAGPMSGIQNALGSPPGLTKAGDWTDVACDTPNGTTVTWKKLCLTGKMEFYYKAKDGKESYKSLDGIVDVFLREDKGQTLILLWRVPTHIEASIDLAALEPLVAGCAQ
jgi:hypothetical protein